MDTPAIRPARPNFSSGPCAKHPGYSPAHLDVRALGRSHRSALGKELLGRACEQTARILGLPEGWRVGIVAGSDTGAMEAAMWSMLGARGVDVFAWEAFGKDWVKDITEQLRLPDARVFDAPYGELPDLAQYDGARDAVFTWNGTSGGVCVPHADWIPDDREGLTICDATSAIFSMALPWHKLDVVTYSWQKALGGEGAHGVLLLGPRAVQRLESYTPPWPMPKLFRLTSGGKLSEGIFRGETINTPSMLCVLDYLDALGWVEKMGGVPALIKRSQESFRHIEDFVSQHDWINFLAQDDAVRSYTSVCLTLDLPAEKIKDMQKLLEKEGVAYDIGSYKSAPVGLRIWCGATVEPADVRALMPWLAWAYEQVR